MKFYVLKFRPSSHSEDYTIIAAYGSRRDAEKVEEALLNMLEDMKQNMDSYDTDWSPDEAYVSSEGERVIFEVYSAGYLEDVESVLKKVAKPVEVEGYTNYQRLEISVSVPEGVTPESALLILGKKEAEALRWLLKHCGKPDIADSGKRRVFRWHYEGDGIYDDGTLYVGIEFPVERYRNWTVEELE